MRPFAFVLLILASLAALAFLFLDQGLSGANATNPAYAIGFIVICVALLILLGSGRGGMAAGIGGTAFAIAPFALMAGYYQYNQMRWENRPAAQAMRELAKNVACASSKAGVAEADRRYVAARIRLIYRMGYAGGEGWQKEIEERMAIRILPGCRFVRVARTAPPPPKPTWPENASIDYGDQQAGGAR